MTGEEVPFEEARPDASPPADEQSAQPQDEEGAPEQTEQSQKTDTEDSPGDQEDEEEKEDTRSFQDQLADEELERRLRRESLQGMYGASRWGNRVRAEGDHNVVQTAGGSIHNYYQAGSSEIRAQTPRFAAGEIRELLQCWAPTPTVREVAAALREWPVVVVRGRPDTGRLAASLLALLPGGNDAEHRHVTAPAGDGELLKVGRLLLTVEPVMLRADDLDEGFGYVLDASREPWALAGDGEPLAHLRHLAAQSGCRIVVLTTAESRLAEHAVEHRMPEAMEVFRRRLEYRLARKGLSPPPEWLDKLYADEQLAMALGESCPPYQAVETAETVAEACAKEGLDHPVSVYLANLPSRLREDVQKQLSKKDGEEGTLLQRCFFIAVAVLNGLSAVTVSRAALELAQMIEGREPAAGDPDKSPPSFPSWERLTEWLAYARARSVPAGQSGEGRVVWLNRPAQAELTLQVVWEEHPTIREPLLRWLRHLAEETSDRAVCIKAAHTVGRLAAFDFDAINAEFLEKWASSERKLQQRLAAWALEAAATQQEIAGRVRYRLRRWARASRTRRSVAARAYGSSIGTAWLADALEAFEQILQEPGPRALQSVVACSLVDLFAPSTAGAIVRRLDAWCRHDHPGRRRTAALTFNRLAARAGASDYNLADLPLEQEPELRAALVRLWCNALSGDLLAAGGRSTRKSASGKAAWDVLADWLARWDRLRTLQPVIDDLFRLPEEHRRLAAPLRLHLRLWCARKTVPRPLAGRLAGLMPKS